MERKRVAAFIDGDKVFVTFSVGRVWYAILRMWCAVGVHAAIMDTEHNGHRCMICWKQRR